MNVRFFALLFLCLVNGWSFARADDVCWEGSEILSSCAQPSSFGCSAVAFQNSGFCCFEPPLSVCCNFGQPNGIPNGSSYIDACPTGTTCCITDPSWNCGAHNCCNPGETCLTTQNSIGCAAECCPNGQTQCPVGWKQFYGANSSCCSNQAWCQSDGSCVPPPCPGGGNCNGQGTCNNGVCTCTGGWTSSANGCTTAPAASPCPGGGNCNGQGTCSNGVCTCTGGWTSSANGCTTAPPSCPGGGNCSGNGACNAGVCTCTGGWTSDASGDCTIQPTACPGGGNCSGNGTCNAGVCTCTGGWTSSANGCTTPPDLDPCSGHGTYSNGVCICTGGWTNDTNGSCTIPPPCPGGGDCSGNGTCSNGVCSCNTGWEKDVNGSCTTPSTCPGSNGQSCSGHGLCNNGQCVCSPSWGLDASGDCTVSSTPPCPGGGDCSGNGNCNSGICSCNTGWMIDGNGSCTTPLTPCPGGGNCSGNGTCSNGVCTCSGGWTIDGSGNCTIAPAGCPGGGCGNGTCNQTTGICTCTGGWGVDASGSCTIEPLSQESVLVIDANGDAQHIPLDAWLANQAAQQRSQNIQLSLQLLNPVYDLKLLSSVVAQAFQGWVVSNIVTPANNALDVDISLTPSSGSSQRKNFESLSDAPLQLSYQYTPNADGSFNLGVLIGGETLGTIQMAPLSSGTIATDSVQIQVTANVTVGPGASSPPGAATSSSSSGSKTAIIAGAVAGGVAGVAAITTTVVLLVKYFKAKAAAALANVVPLTKMDNVVLGGGPHTPTDPNNNSQGDSQDSRDHKPDSRRRSPRWGFGLPGGLDSAAMGAMINMNDNGSSSGIASPSEQELLAPENMSPLAVSDSVLESAPPYEYASLPMTETCVDEQDEQQCPVIIQRTDPRQSRERVLEQHPTQLQIVPVIMPSAPIKVTGL